MSTDTRTREEVDLSEVFDHLWAVIVLNDDVTSFATVITALMNLFGHSEQAADRLAWVVHTEGEAVVAVLDEDSAKTGVEGLHTYGIQATMRKA